MLLHRRVEGEIKGGWVGEWILNIATVLCNEFNEIIMMMICTKYDISSPKRHRHAFPLSFSLAPKCPNNS